MQDRLSTGSEILDRRLNGGIPPGKLIAITAPPDTQSELFLEALTRERPTLYLSTQRPPEGIRESLDVPDNNLTVVHEGPETLLADPETYFTQVEPKSNVIIDPMTGFETSDRREYVELLNSLKSYLRANESIGVVHCINSPRNPHHRGLTLNHADLVWRLELILTTLSIETRLIISKFRGGSALKEPIKLLLTDQVRIDTSRDIA